MKTDLLLSPATAASTPLLAVFAVDRNTSKDKDAKADLAVLSSEPALQKAAAFVLSTGEFRAEMNETLLLHAPEGLAAARLLVIGLGKTGKATLHDLRRAAGTAVRFAKPRGIKALAIAVPEDFDAAAAARVIAEGAIVGDFDSDTYRTDRKDRSLDAVTVLAPASSGKAALEAALVEGIAVAESQNFARTLINEPGNRMTPTILGQKAAEMAKEVGIQCEVYGAEKLRELKMGSFLSVTLGSEEPPVLIVMKYEPEHAPADGPVIGLVGKGITFDSGGISLKPGEGMEKMKYDMAGGAAMIGAMRAIALLKPNVRVLSVVCATENMPDGKAQKPGDIQIAMSGKSIEIINTDAEGRLVLADGLHYARELGATHLIDAATLTGAVAVALGQVNAGAFSNDEETFEHFTEAANISGEKFWRLPVEDEYREQIQSPIADIQNTGKTRYGGAITAAMFLKEFVGDTPWVHLDIAGLAWLDADKSFIARGPSGIGVRTITEWVRTYAK
ncbi:leucyl aminopeptidase [Silvibacterium dinghuense]|uniref:Probable cytosol aminopeptidase n=1 Tax=Silvibacterium dinghuense TaxID=1560006 RepID=A0A4V1NVR8_9BACT|nr:leucyl aminopeptidase [Silvibacterium dinghuense]RXS96872.1 leucyl aminopeptidase [Silvibacterium dinghuense]GGG94335.1 putative cytosol aminopeptidase [Silvibacterium dinghuense]